MGLMPMISCPYIFTIAAGELRIFCTSEILMVFFIMSLLLCSLMFWCFLGFIHVSSTQMFFYLSLGQPTLLSVPYTFSADIDGQSLKWCHSISISATWSQSGSDVLFRDKNSYYHCNKWSFVELILFLSQWEDFFYWRIIRCWQTQLLLSEARPSLVSELWKHWRIQACSSR